MHSIYPKRVPHPEGTADTLHQPTQTKADGASSPQRRSVLFYPLGYKQSP